MASTTGNQIHIVVAHWLREQTRLKTGRSNCTGTTAHQSSSSLDSRTSPLPSQSPAVTRCEEVHTHFIKTCKILTIVRNQTCRTVSICSLQGRMNISDSIFTNNDLVHSGYMGSSSRTTFTRCRFVNNRRCLDAADKVVLDSVFDSNDCALCGVERMTVRRSLFKNHRQYAISGRGPEISDCVFIGNKAAYKNTGDGGFTFQRNIVTGGETGIVVAHPHPAVRNNNICGNSVNNLEVVRQFDVDVGCNWLGVGNEVAARGKIKDGWSVNGRGTAKLDHLSLAPFSLGREAPEDFELHPCMSRPCDESVNCSDHGMCSADGACVCLPGWTGAQCDVCVFGLVPSPVGEKCARSCGQYSSCTTCLSTSTCGWCRRPQQSRCAAEQHDSSVRSTEFVLALTTDKHQMGFASLQLRFRDGFGHVIVRINRAGFLSRGSVRHFQQQVQ